MPKSSFHYRVDIDGLRAIAIIPVVFFHAGMPGFSGGFVGVDVFFVISGFLITGIILREQSEQSFTLLGFWARRARRIFPALGAVVLATLIFGWLVLMPEDYTNMGRTAAAQAIFVSNIDLYRNSGYFSAPAHANPLLHTWSLAVEEQFYLFFPLLLVGLGKFLRRRRLQVLSLLLLGSLAWSVQQLTVDASAAFFLMQYRAWELLMGAVMALLVTRPSPGHAAWLDELAALLGIIAIAAAVFAYDRNTPFPGLAALLPSVGAALLIWANRERATLVGKLLSLQWVVWIGLISYSLYLWHWPVLVFTRYTMNVVTPEMASAAVAGSVLLAWISYRWIETPVRRSRVLVSGRQLFAASIVLLLTFAVVGTTVRLAHGFPSRLGDQARRMYAEAVRKPPPCEAVPLGEGLSVCERGTPGEPATLLVWGDSHARAMLPVIDRIAAERSVNYLIQGCPPLNGIYVAGLAEGVDDYHCTSSNSALFEYLRRQPVKEVLLISRWAVYVEGREDDAPDGAEPDMFLGDMEIPPTNRRASRAVFARHLPRTVQMLRATGATVWLLRQVPEQLFWVPNELARAMERGTDLSTIGRTLVSHRQRQAFVDEVINRLGDTAVALDPADLLCQPGNFCRVERDGRALYFDNDHLTEYGAMQLQPLLERLFVSAPGSQ